MSMSFIWETDGRSAETEELLRRVADACLALEGIENAGFCVTVTDHERIRALNHRMRGIDQVTDVLSFPTVRFRPGTTAGDDPDRIRREDGPARGGGQLGGSHYAASKGGVISFTKALARELGPRGVRANCVAPGIIETDMTLGKFGENWEQALKQGIPLQRFGSPAEVAQAILFLASDLSSYSTGIVVDVNGGFHIH